MIIDWYNNTNRAEGGKWRACFKGVAIHLSNGAEKCDQAPGHLYACGNFLSGNILQLLMTPWTPETMFLYGFLFPNKYVSHKFSLVWTQFFFMFNILFRLSGCYTAVKCSLRLHTETKNFLTFYVCFVSDLSIWQLRIQKNKTIHCCYVEEYVRILYPKINILKRL